MNIDTVGVKELIAGTIGAGAAAICSGPVGLAATVAAGTTFLNRAVHRLTDPVIPDTYYLQSIVSYSISSLLILSPIHTLGLASVPTLFFIPGGIATVAYIAFWKFSIPKPAWYVNLRDTPIPNGQNYDLHHLDHWILRRQGIYYVRPKSQNSRFLSRVNYDLIRAAIRKNDPEARFNVAHTQQDHERLWRCIQNRTKNNQVIQFDGHDIRIITNEPWGAIRCPNGAIQRAPFLILAKGLPAHVRNVLSGLLSRQAHIHQYAPADAENAYFDTLSRDIEWLDEKIFLRDTFFRRLRTSVDENKAMNGLITCGDSTFRVIVNPEGESFTLPDGTVINERIFVSIEKTQDPEPETACREFTGLIHNYYKRGYDLSKSGLARKAREQGPNGEGFRAMHERHTTPPAYTSLHNPDKDTRKHLFMVHRDSLSLETYTIQEIRDKFGGSSGRITTNFQQAARGGADRRRRIEHVRRQRALDALQRQFDAQLARVAARLDAM